MHTKIHLYVVCVMTQPSQMSTAVHAAMRRRRVKVRARTHTNRHTKAITNTQHVRTMTTHCAQLVLQQHADIYTAL